MYCLSLLSFALALASVNGSLHFVITFSLTTVLYFSDVNYQTILAIIIVKLIINTPSIFRTLASSLLSLILLFNPC